MALAARMRNKNLVILREARRHVVRMGEDGN